MLDLAWAERALRAANHALNPQEAIEARELLLAGVPKVTIAELYPFDLRAYVPGLLRLCALRKTHKQLRAILEPIDVLYDLALHMPEAQDKALWTYAVRGAYVQPPTGNGNGVGMSTAETRLESVSPELLAVAQKFGLMTEIETMLLTIHLLHLLHEYPFLGQPWEPVAQASFEGAITAVAADITAWTIVLSANIAYLRGLSA